MPLALLAVLSLLATAGRAEEKRSGYQDASPETRAMQDDDTANPAFLWVQQGEALWTQQPATQREVARTAMAPPRHRCAAWRRAIRPSTRTSAGRSPWQQRIKQCRTERQGSGR